MKRALILTAAVVVAWLALGGGLRLIANPPAGPQQQQAAVTVPVDQQPAVIDFNHHRDALMVAWHCEPVPAWKAHHPGQIPRNMLLHRYGSGLIFIDAWTYPAAPGLLVLGFCS